MAVKQTAGRDALGNFAPKFAELNDDVLFGEVWSREELLPLKTRSIVTITALISKGITDSSLKYHLSTAKANGVTKTEMAEILTHLAFYAGWPNAWAAFNMAKEIYDENEPENHGGFFGQGQGLAHIRFVVLSHGRCLPVVVRFCHCTEFFTGWQGEAGGGRPLSFVPAPRACRAAR